MRKRNLLIVIALLSSLFIYLFYRTERTLVNEIAKFFISSGLYDSVKESVNEFLPLSEPIVYSLPEGLWVFCITLTSQHIYIQLFNRKIPLVLLPLVFSIGLEFLQLLHITNGYFDFMDIIFSVFFWELAAITTQKSEPRSLLNPFDRRSIFCILTYCIVYLAHVFEN